MHDGSISFHPTIPENWDGFELRLRTGSHKTTFRISRVATMTNGNGEGTNVVYAPGDSISLEEFSHLDEVVIDLNRATKPPEKQSHYGQTEISTVFQEIARTDDAQVGTSNDDSSNEIVISKPQASGASPI